MFILTALSLFACGTDPAPESAADAAVLGPDALRADVEVLASDDFRGRGTGEDGADKAAAWLTEAFSDAGLKPLPERQFTVPYTLYERSWDRAGTQGSIQIGDTKTEWTAGTDFRPFPFSDPGQATAPVVFAGYAIQSEDLSWDDFADLDVEGKWILVLRHNPGEGDEDSPWAEDQTHSAFLTKAMRAQEQGAVGMLLVTDPLHHDEADDLRMSGRLRLDPPADPPPMDPDAPTLLALQISQDAANQIVAAGGHDLAAMQTALNNGEAVNRDLGVEASVTLTPHTEPEALHPVNVVGYVEGASKPDEWVVIGAHYDHLGAYHGEGDTVFNGADDNASGTAGLVALARAIASGPQPERSVVFAAFSGEEKGLLGSRAAVRDGVLPAEKVAFMLNLDMIGRRDSGTFEVVGDGYSTGTREAVEQAGTGIELDVTFAGTDYSGNSDHHPFYEQDVPFAFFFSGLHDDYHQLGDHSDKLDYEHMSRVVRLGHAFLSPLADGSWTPRFVHHADWLGATISIVDGEHGTDAVVTEVQPETRAATAGMQVGDRVLAFDDTRLERAEDVGSALRAIEPGSQVQIAASRGTEQVVFEVMRAKTGYLGVFPRGVSEEVAEKHGLMEGEGVQLAQVVPNGPADQAGLKVEDILFRVRGVPVGPATLSRVLRQIGAGEEVPVTVIRDDERVELTMVLGERPRRD